MSKNRARNWMVTLDATVTTLSSSEQEVRDRDGVLELTGNYTLLSTDPIYIHCSAAAGMTCSLPAAGGLRNPTGEPLRFHILDSGRHAEVQHIRVSGNTNLMQTTAGFIIKTNHGYVNTQWSAGDSKWFILDTSGSSGTIGYEG